MISGMSDTNLFQIASSDLALRAHQILSVSFISGDSLEIHCKIIKGKIIIKKSGDFISYSPLALPKLSPDAFKPKYSWGSFLSAGPQSWGAICGVWAPCSLGRICSSVYFPLWVIHQGLWVLTILCLWLFYPTCSFFFISLFLVLFC